jgi:hypothetical protein
MWKADAKSAARNLLQDAQSRLAEGLWAGSLGGGQASGEMRLGGWVSRGESALLFRFRPAHRATHRQDAPQRELLWFHTTIIQQRQAEYMDNPAHGSIAPPKWEIIKN